MIPTPPVRSMCSLPVDLPRPLPPSLPSHAPATDLRLACVPPSGPHMHRIWRLHNGRRPGERGATEPLIHYATRGEVTSPEKRTAYVKALRKPSNSCRIRSAGWGIKNRKLVRSRKHAATKERAAGLSNAQPSSVINNGNFTDTFSP